MNHNIKKDNPSEKTDKKVMGGSFFTSLLFHGILLLIIGGIVIAPGAVKRFMPVTQVAPPPVDIPPPPPVVDQAPSDQTSSDNTPLSEPAEVKATTQDNTPPPESLVVPDASSMGPQIATGSGTEASGVSGDLFSHGGTKGGTGTEGSGLPSFGHKSTFFGTTGDDLKGLLLGQFYNIYFDKNGTEFAQYPDRAKIFIDFAKSHGNVNVLSPYWKSKQLYHATHIIIPGIPKLCEFEAFGEKIPQLKDPNVAPFFVIHYRGKIAAPNQMTFRFTGASYAQILVLVDGELVFLGEAPWNVAEARLSHQKSLPIFKEQFGWESPDEVLSIDAHPEQIPDNVTGLHPFYTFGKWMTWNPNEYHKIDILMSALNTALFIQEKDKDYKKTPTNIPILPAFQVSKRENFSPEYYKKNPNFKLNGVDFAIYQEYGVDTDNSKGPLFLTEEQ